MREGDAPVKIRSQKFSPGERIDLDGNSFENCQFDQTVMVFQANAPVSFEGCTFNAVLWNFDGKASLTVQFIKALSEATGDYGRALIVNTFPSLKDWMKPEALSKVLGQQSV
jgi:hypothetical protein